MNQFVEIKKGRKLKLIVKALISFVIMVFILSSSSIVEDLNGFFYFKNENSLRKGIYSPGLGSVLAQTPASYPVHSGFPIIYDRWTERTSATIADINNDGKMEILLPTYDGRIFAFNASGATLSGFPIITGAQIRGYLTLGDLNKDGDLEIAAGLDSPNSGVAPRVGIWNPNGTAYTGWPKTTDCASSGISCNISAIVMSDVDKDSYLEVIAATNNRIIPSDPFRGAPNLYLWESNGNLMSGWPKSDDQDTAIIGQIAVGDLSGDTYPDIVTGRDYNRLFAFNRSGANLNNWPHHVWYPYDRNIWTDDQIEFPRSSPALADLNQDGYLEYIIPGHRRGASSSTYSYPELLVYNANATRFSGWETPAQGSSLNWVSNTTRMIEAPAIADLNGDGKPEIILATQDGYVRAYNAEKQKLWEYNYYQGSQVHTSEVVVGDVDGDGKYEVVFGTFWLNLVTKGNVGIYILNHDGTENAKLLLNSIGISNTPSLGDLDGDGLIEIAAATYDGYLYVWDTPGLALPERLPWPMARHDLQRTGMYKDISPSFSQSSKRTSTSNAIVGETVTYTIQLVRTGSTLVDTITLTDLVPSGLSYVPGSLSSTAGMVDASDAPRLRWTGAGSLFDQGQVTITYRAIVTTIIPTGIKNTATLDARSAGEYHFSSTLIANGKIFYLPIIHR